jgi:TRAP-type C4-dicarboxylate transport system permease small subunit
MNKKLRYVTDHIEAYILVFILCMIAFVMLLQIIMRYFFNTPLSWPEELCRYLYIWMCFIGLSFCLHNMSELRVDFLEKMLRGRLQLIFKVLLTAISILFYSYLLTQSISVFTKIYHLGQSSPAAGIPMFLVYMAMPVSFSLTVIRAVQKLIREVKSKPSNHICKE